MKSGEDERLLRPLRRGPGVCTRCFNLTDGFGLCFACTLVEPWLDHMASISYSVSGSPLHRALWSYKHLSGRPASHARLELAILLGHFLARHESCLASAIGRQGFDLITTVPSSDRARDQGHPLRTIVQGMIPLTAERHERVLVRSSVPTQPHRFDPERFSAVRPLGGEAVLLLDDTWTTGANAQSAAAALRRAGSGPVAALAIGRHLNRSWLDHKHRLAELEGPFRWETCPACATPGQGSRASQGGA